MYRWAEGLKGGGAAVGFARFRSLTHRSESRCDEIMQIRSLPEAHTDS